MKLGGLGRVPHALVVAGMVSSMGAASAWGAAGDNGQYFMIEGLYLEKDDGDTLALTAPDGAGVFNLITDDVIELDGTGGARATAQFVAFGHTWQASAFGVVSYDQDFFVSNLDVPGNNTSTTYAEFVGGTDPSVNEPFNSDQLHALDLNLEAELWGAEFSWVKNLESYGFKNVDLLVGVRYIHYGEDLGSVAFDESDDLPGGVFDNDIDSAFIGIDNDLVGLQVGLQGMWAVTSSISVGGSLKGGIAANFVDRERSYFGTGGGALPAFSDSHDDTGFAQFAEFNPRVDIALSETATLTIGGTVMWINETSRAASHYQTLADRTDGNVRDDDDEIFYGASVGLKLALN
jgi:hypothetical protein